MRNCKARTRTKSAPSANSQSQPAPRSTPKTPHCGNQISSRSGGFVHDREPEQIAVEGDRALEVRRDGGDMVQPAELHALAVVHGPAG
jgi:hypothetical protein